MKRLTHTAILILTIAIALTSTVKTAHSANFVVYSVYKELDMGNPGEIIQKDYYLNMGSTDGLHKGSTVTVYRKISTYDLLSEKLYKDITFPIAKLKIIHVENNAAVARVESMVSGADTPALAPRAVMIGDLVSAR